MQKKIKIDIDNSVKICEEIGNFLNPDFVYLPVIANARVGIDSKSIVYKGDLVFSSDTDVVFSPVSGSIKTIVEKEDLNGEKNKYLVIENDFREKTKVRKAVKNEIFNYTKDEFLDLVSKFNPSLGNLLSKKYSGARIIVRALDDEPYIFTESVSLLNHTHDILELLDYISRTLKTKSGVIMVKSTDNKTINKVINLVGSYPRLSIKIMDDIYPLNDVKVIKEIFSKKDLILTVSELLEIMSYIKREKPIFEKYLTISGNAVNNPMIVNVKIGASIKELIDNLVKIDITRKYHYYVNGLMRGNKYENIDEIIIDKDLSGIIINHDKKEIKSKCINCGLCLKVCPLKMNPLNKDKKCINCGLCSYVCPSRIDLLERNDSNEN